MLLGGESKFNYRVNIFRGYKRSKRLYNACLGMIAAIDAWLAYIGLNRVTGIIVFGMLFTGL